MNKERQRKLYLLLVLLIMLLVAIIGGLATALFHMQFAADKPKKVAEPVKTYSNRVARITPSSEKYIEVAPTELPEAPPERVETVATVTPRVCEGYGPQIKNRPAYKHPARYTATVQPGHIRFIVYPPPSSSGSSD
jgi:cytoskeletal protein RodZ